MYFSNILKVKKCCCCVSLRTGCLIIGYLETAGNAFALINTFQNNDAGYYEYLISNILIPAIFIVLNVLMLLGIHQEKKKLLLPWIISKFIAYFCITFMYGKNVFETVILLIQFDTDQKLLALSALIVGGFTLLVSIAWYTFLCVSNLYLMKNEQEKKEEKMEEKKEKKKDK